MKRETFNLNFTALVKAFFHSGQKIDPETQDVYWEMLKDIRDEYFTAAVRFCLVECKFFPTIFELTEASQRRSFSTGVVERLKLDEPSADPEVIRNFIEDLVKNCEPKAPQEAFAQRDYTNIDIRCMGCGQIFRLGWANGNEKYVLCEDCNRKEARKFQ